MASTEIIDVKLDYLDTTKGLIKQAMKNKGIDVTDEDTFRSYAEKINSLVLEKDQSDATATAEDIVAGKIAYNDNNKVIGTLFGYNSLTAEPSALVKNDNTNKLSASYKVDSRTLLNSDASINTDIPYAKIAETISLSPEIIKEGETVLGVTGTMIPTEDLEAQLAAQDELIAKQQEQLDNLELLLENKTEADITAAEYAEMVALMDQIIGIE